MKATINKRGLLSVIAETELESFALTAWVKDRVECHRPIFCKCGEHHNVPEGEWIIKGEDIQFDRDTLGGE